MNYRIFDFFHGSEAVVVSHGVVKERIVPAKETELAEARADIAVAENIRKVRAK
jgi:hypothetical protein